MLIITQRCIRILMIICRAAGPVTVRQIAEELKISERTARYDLSTLKDWLGEREITLLGVPRKGISLGEADRRLAQALVEEVRQESASGDLIQSSEERVQSIVVRLLERDTDTTIDDASEAQGVSRTTILRDLDKAAEWFDTHKATLRRRQKRGVRLEADELKRRSLTVDFILENSNESSFLSYLFQHGEYDNISVYEHSGLDYVTRIFRSVDAAQLLDTINEVLSRLGMELEDSALLWVFYYLAVLKTRVGDGHYLDALPERYQRFAATEECGILADCIGRCAEEQIPAQCLCNEAAFLTAKLFASSKTAVVRVRRETGTLADQVAHYLIGEADRRAGYDFSRDKELGESLRMHLQLSITRAQLEMPAKNAMLDEITEKFPQLFDLCSQIAADIDRNFHIRLDVHEVGFLTLHLAASIERRREKVEQGATLRVALVCGYGVGTVAFLMRSLEKQFPNIIIVDRLSIFAISNYNFSKIDAVISTICIPIPLPKPVIKVKPIMTKLDLRRIDAFLRSGVTAKSTVPDFRVSELLGIIQESCIVQDSDKLVADLSKAMSLHLEPVLPATSFPSLPELLQKKYLLAGIEASDWEDAVIKAAQPLLENNCFTQVYIDDIFHMRNAYNQYAVIAGGVCMPHAMPLPTSKLAMSLVTLKQPVEVCIDGQNISLRIFMVLSLVDSISHTIAMDEMFTLLDEFPNFVDDLCNAANTAELGRILRVYYEKLF